MVNVEGFKRGYKLVFAFPTARVLTVLVLASLCLTVCLSLLNSRSLPESVIVIVFTLIVNPFLMRASNPELFTWRRVYGLVPPLLCLWCILTLIHSSPLGATLALSSLLYYTAVRALASLPFAALLLVPSLAAMLALNYLLAAALFAVGVALLELCIIRIKGRTSKVGVDALEGFRAFASYILCNKRGLLEAFLSKLSRERDVFVDVIKILSKQGKLLGCIVVPYIHPGPFREVGSSPLPSFLAETARKAGIDILVLHGVSGHELDLVKSEDTHLVIKEVLNWTLSDSSSSIPVREAGLSCTKEGGIGAICIDLGLPLVMLYHINGGEDFPFVVAETLWKEVGTCTVVDLHNALGASCSQDEAVRAAIKAIKSLRRAEKVEASIVSLSSSLSPLEVGPGGVSALAARIGDKTLCLVCFDSNNALLSVREAVTRALRNLGVNVPLLATTDTHLMTGARPGRDYYPLGSVSGQEKVAQEAVRAAKAAISKLEEVGAIVHERLKFRTKTLDPVNLEALSKVTEDNVKDYLVTLAVACGLILLSLVL